MKKAQLKAFVEAARVTFETMLDAEVRPGAVERGHGAVPGYDVSGIVGLSQLAGRDGSIVLSFPEDVARQVVGRVLGADDPPLVLDQDVADGIGEIVNVVAGNAKVGLARAGVLDCMTTLPSVILGSQHRIFHQRDADCWAVTMDSDVGEFVLQVLLTAPVLKDAPRARRSEEA